jgi:hypothetical protein
MIAKEKTKQEDMTIKQRKWLKLYLDIGNATEAAMQAYKCKNRNSAKQIGYENLAKLDYAEFMEEGGLTDNLLKEKLGEGLESNRTISAIKGTNADGTTTDFIDVPDFAVRHRYLETAMKLKNRLIDRKDITSGGKPLPQPILDALSNNDSNTQDKSVKEEN